MSADKAPTQRVAGIVVGQSTLQVWGLTSEARLQRQFARAGVVATPADADRVVLLRADWVFDESLVRGLAGATDDVALRADDGEVVALSVAVAQADEAARLLAERQALAGARTVSPAQIADGYNDKLRKREPPYLLPLTAESMDAIEWRTFRGAYKGVTDLVTLYAWPRPARYVTRLCAEAGITPNQVTSLSLVLVLAAMWLFWTGHYGWGLVAAWGMTFLDTVDGKLARVTLNSSRFGDFFDHSIDLVHPPFWWWAWIVGLTAVGLPLTHAALALTAIVAGYVLQRLEEGLFIACFGIEMHVWERFDSRFRLITARRNPNLLLLTASLPFGRPDLGILAVAIWTVACLVVHAVRLLQAAVARRRGPLRSWLSRRDVSDELRALIDDELRRAVPLAVVTLAERLAARVQGGAAAVLFYGSALRDSALDGVLDFYVLVDHVGDWPGPWLAACANRVLPPNVGYLEEAVDGRSLRAKYAVMTVAQFRRAMSVQRIDTTLWARFSQPCACIHARSEADRLTMRDAVCDAVVAAAHWAAMLGPLRAEPVAFWRALYARTYAAELRVERSTRGADLLTHDGPRYARLLPLAWEEGGLAFTTAPGEVAPVLAPDERTTAEHRWRMRRRLGPVLNLLRLLKAALTFDNATDYVAWKVERHSGYRIEPTDFQRRHPLLAAPGIYWRLRRRGVLR